MYKVTVVAILSFVSWCRLLLHDESGLSQNAEVTKFCESLYASENRSPYLLALIVDMCDEQVSQGNHGDPNYNLERAKSLCHDLANKYDTVRVKYWEYMADMIQKKAGGGGDSGAST